MAEAKHKYTGGKARSARRVAGVAAPEQPSPLGGILVPVLLFLVLASSIAVVQSSHKSRRQFSELQELRREAMALEEEWGRLLLEQSTWASPDRVQRLAEDELQMRPPDMREAEMVRGYGKAG